MTILLVAILSFCQALLFMAAKDDNVAEWTAFLNAFLTFLIAIGVMYV